MYGISDMYYSRLARSFTTSRNKNYVRNLCFLLILFPTPMTILRARHSLLLLIIEVFLFCFLV